MSRDYASASRAPPSETRPHRHMPEPTPELHLTAAAARRIAMAAQGFDRPPAGGVLGTRGIVDSDRKPSVAPLADGGCQPRGMGLDLEDRARPARAGGRDARARRRAGPDPGTG